MSKFIGTFTVILLCGAGAIAQLLSGSRNISNVQTTALGNNSTVINLPNHSVRATDRKDKYQILPDSIHNLQQERQTEKTDQKIIAKLANEDIQVVPLNLISNGAFEKMEVLGWKTFRKLEGWEISIVELGQGYIYNSNWPQGTIVAELDVHKNQVMDLPLMLEKGSYVAIFDWAPRSGMPLSTSQIQLKWNGEILTTLKAHSDQVLTHSIIFQSSGNKNTLTFAGAGNSDSTGATISNVRVYKTMSTAIEEDRALKTDDVVFSPVSQDAQNLTVIRQNLLTNGEFEKQGRFRNVLGADLVQSPGWQFELGKLGTGLLHNLQWNANVVAMLDRGVNIDMTLLIDVPEGNYYAAFDWAPAQNIPFSTSQIELRWNGKLIDTLFATENKVFTQPLVFKSTGNRNKLTFTGAGRADNYGAAISKAVVYVMQNEVQEFAIYPSYTVRPQNLNGNFQYFQEYLPTSKYITDNQLRFWQFVGLGEIGFGQHYNSHWFSLTTLIDLDAGKNVNYTTEFQGNRELYLLSFDFAAQEGSLLNTCALSVFFNGQQVLITTPVNYQIQRQYLTLKGNKGKNSLSFKGEGLSDGIGANINNVEVHQISQTQ